MSRTPSRPGRALCALSVCLLLLVAARSAQAVPPDALGDLRLIFSAEERLAIDAKRLAGLSTELPVSPDRSEVSTADTANRQRTNPSGRQRVPARPERDRPSLRRIDFTGILESSQGHTYLINGMPWQPGALGIRSIDRDADSGQIELRFDTGESAILSIGQGIARAARS